MMISLHCSFELFLLSKSIDNGFYTGGAIVKVVLDCIKHFNLEYNMLYEMHYLTTNSSR